MFGAEMMDETQETSAGGQRPRWGGLASWVLSLIGGGVAFATFTLVLGIGFIYLVLPSAFIFSVGAFVPIIVVGWAIVGAIAGAIAGIIPGTMQRLVLHRHVSWSQEWLRATVVGWAMGGALMILLAVPVPRHPLGGEVWRFVLADDDRLILPILMAFVGLALHSGQWFVLRRHGIRATVWLFTTCGASALAYIIVAVLRQMSLSFDLESVVTACLVGGGIVGCVSGLALYTLVWARRGEQQYH